MTSIDLTEFYKQAFEEGRKKAPTIVAPGKEVFEVIALLVNSAGGEVFIASEDILNFNKNWYVTGERDYKRDGIVLKVHK